VTVAQSALAKNPAVIVSHDDGNGDSAMNLAFHSSSLQGIRAAVVNRDTNLHAYDTADLSAEALTKSLSSFTWDSQKNK
jgi:hypothetical protein